MFIEVKTDKGVKATLSLMRLEAIMTDDDGKTILFMSDGTEIPYRTNEPYEALVSRLGRIVGTHRQGVDWRAPA